MRNNTCKEMRQILDAIVQGTGIQFRRIDAGETGAWEDYDYSPLNFADFLYRVKPEQKWRPFASVDEFLKAAGGLGMIWLKRKDNGAMHLVGGIDTEDKKLPIYLSAWVSFAALFTDFVFLDGTPCGVKE